MRVIKSQAVDDIIIIVVDVITLNNNNSEVIMISVGDRWIYELIRSRI